MVLRFFFRSPLSQRQKVGRRKEFLPMSLFDDDGDEFDMDNEKFDRIIREAAFMKKQRDEQETVEKRLQTLEEDEEKRKKQRTNAFDFMKLSQHQKQQNEHVLQQQNYQQQQQQQIHQSVVKRVSILPSESSDVGRVKFQLFILAPSAQKFAFGSLVAKFDAAFVNTCSGENKYERSEQLQEINNGIMIKNTVAWDNVPHGKLDAIVGCLKRQFTMTDAVNILYPHPIVRRALRLADRMVPDKSVEKQFNSIPFKDKFFPFQSEGVKFVLKRNGRAMIGDEMGLGKSIQALACCKVFSNDWPCVIFCPSSLKDTWKHEIEKWLGGGCDEEECAVKVRKIESAKESKDILNEMRKNGIGINSSERPKIDFLVVPYSICNQIQRDLFELVFNVLKANVVVCDESHFLKDRKAKRTMAVVPFLKRAKRAMCLTGTPALAKPIELYSQMLSLRPDIFPKLSEYGQRYCSGGRFGAFSGSSESQELFAVVSSSVMIRRKKKDVLTQLPPKQREQIFLEIPKAERNSKIQPIVTAMNELPETETLERKMLMNKYYLHTAEAKVKMVQKYLENLLESVEEEKKILFFAHHKCLLHAAVETMEKTKTKFIHIDGETPSGLRQGLVDSFQRDANSPKVAILSIKAAGVGLTLTRASLVVFSEYSWTPAEILQAEDRAHRIGQRDSVLVQFLHAKDSVDDIIWQSVQNKLENLGRFLDGTRKGNKMETKMEDINAPDRRQSFDASQKTLHEFVSRS